MTISLFWRIKTEDFDAWLNPDPEALAQMFQPQGVLAVSVYRGADDPNAATILMEFADRDAADAFEAWHAVAKVECLKQSPGSVHETVERGLGHEVTSHTMRLG